MLTKVKDPVPPEDKSGVVYKIGCICGNVYVHRRNQSTIEHEDLAACGLANLETPSTLGRMVTALSGTPSK